MNGEISKDPALEALMKKAEAFVLDLQKQGIDIIKMELHREHLTHRWAVQVTVRKEDFMQVMRDRG